MNTPIYDFLNSYTAEKFIRCHTPGHKGLSFPHDITEIEGSDSLFESTGIIARSEDNAAGLFGAAKTLYSCSGSTLAVQTMLALIKTSTDKNRIAAYRYCHRSFVSASALLGFEVDWFNNINEIKTAINDKTAAVFVTSINYLGEMFDIKTAAKICKRKNIPLLTDNAHGAYLVLTEEHPIKLGAAMSADSAHKTLPALTGAAYLHINDHQYIQDAKSMMALFGTSSPSYLILESLDLCNKHIYEDNIKSFGLVKKLKQEIGFPLRESDALRITVNARDIGYTGFELAQKLRENKVECEYADENCTVLLFSTITTRQETEAVKAAFAKTKLKKAIPPVIYPVLKPKKAVSIREAVFSCRGELCSPDKAVNKICAEIIAPCPPGVPIIMPGEIIGREEAQALELFNIEKIKVI